MRGPRKGETNGKRGKGSHGDLYPSLFSQRSMGMQ